MLSLVLAALAALVLGATSASATGGKLKCFADTPATCTLNSSTSATIDSTQGGDAGVYLSNGKSTNGFPLANVSFSFTYLCDSGGVTSCIGGGAPRWSIPISTDGTATTAGYAFLDAQNCLNGGTAANSDGTLTVSTTQPTCPVFFQSGQYANWDAFAAANPTFTISAALPFVISDVPTGGAIDVSNLIVTKS
ncbi:MAG TPA: hypothetical protein VFK22_08385 [Candidatus Dormibacteraeota bacterium]|nr:hypothetical protein [Candidatus Dormibacteraeota bacterium]